MHFSRLPALQHELVALRVLEPGDVDAWYAYLCLPQVFAHTSWNVRAPGELLGHAWSEQASSASSALRFAIVLQADGKLVGTAGFHSVSPENRSAELAYDLAPEFWGRGIASAVCGALVEWAHSCAGVIRVQAVVLESNARSAKVLQRCGFMREGLLHSYRMVRGTPGNFHMYSHVVGPDTAA